MSKTIRVSQITISPEHNMKQVKEKACKLAGISMDAVLDIKIIKQSIDARKKHELHYSYTVDLTVHNKQRFQKNTNVTEITPVRYQPKHIGKTYYRNPIAVVGTGPAGLFCAYLLAINGYSPIVFERGKQVEERQKDVERFWNGGPLLLESNVQFGEGGAGTFSDGKLNTLVKDKYGRNRFVLETFVKFGAPEDILFVSKPHIGTDILRDVVRNMRKEIIRLGGTFYFSSKITDIKHEHGRLQALEINCEKWISVTAAIFAIGHSARDTFEMLYRNQVPLTAKSFAVGLRVEHPQAQIDRNQYADSFDIYNLPAADYKLTYQASNRRSVYSFCMCPGGYVVNASSEQKRLAVNGMSYRSRTAQNANSAIIVSIGPDDFDQRDDPFGGLRFQQKLEENAYTAGCGKIPQQLFGDFENDKKSKAYGAFTSCVKGQTSFANMRSIFPESVNLAFIEAMHAFSGKIKGFDREDAILSGVESRTSSPIRITRDESFMSTISGLYPCGEGAGYAGGITSAAMDGLKVAEAIMNAYRPTKGV